MWSLTSPRTKRISSVRKFRLLPPKDFFDSIGQTEKFGCATEKSALPSRTDILGPACQVRKVPGTIHAPQQTVPLDLYSITTSARASSVADTERPSVLAVLRLIANSNL